MSGSRLAGEAALQRRSDWLAAAAVAVAVAAWELALDRAAGPGVSKRAAEALRAAALDGLLALLLARAALALSSAALHGAVPGAARDAGRAALATVLFVALALPATLARTRVLAALAPGVPVEGDQDALAGALASGAAWLCSAAAGASPRTTGAAEAVAVLRAALLLAPAALVGFGAGLASVRSPAGARRAAAVIALTVAAGVLAWPSPGARVGAAETPCPPGAPLRRYEVSAIALELALDRAGDRDPHGALYVVDADLPAVRERASDPARLEAGLGEDPVAPLVLRAAAGECVEVSFTNRLPEGPAAFHVDGLPWTAGAEGTRGPLPGSAARPGETVRYRLRVPDAAEAERAYPVHDLDGSARADHGLVGALVVEPRGAAWRDASTGAPLTGSSWQAIVDAPGGAFREFVLLHHDVNGLPALNGRAEPLAGRFRAAGENDALAFSSYTYGDPVTPVLRSYLGEPTKLRVVHAGGRGQHGFDLRTSSLRWAHRTKVGPPLVAFGLVARPPAGHNPWLRSDAQALDPGDAYDAEIDCGAGGCERGPGDRLLTCGVAGHAERGEWGLWRVHDTLQPGVAALPGRPPPPAAVTSRALVGAVVEGKRLVPAARLADPARERALEPFVEAQLPPRGRPASASDASVWDWERVDGPDGPLYLGEPGPDGLRRAIAFDPRTGRYAWPLFAPHPGRRPPFPGAGHTPAPWLGEWATMEHPEGVCPTLARVGAGRRARRVYAVAPNAGELLGGVRTPEAALYYEPVALRPVARAAEARPPSATVLPARVFDCVDVLYADDGDGPTARPHARPDLRTHFVRSDPQASQGIAAGFSFSQHAEPYRRSGRVLARATAAGATVLALSHARGLRAGVDVAVGLGEGRCDDGAAARAPRDAPPADAERCTEVARIATVLEDAVVLEAPLRHAHAAGAYVDVEFVRFLWYSDDQYGLPLERDPRSGPAEARTARR